jgi:hypothetical protein
VPSFVCHACGRELSRDRVGVRDLCAACGAWLHCCRNCDHYAPGLANDCREPAAERVPDKEQGNFCDWFRTARVPAAATTTGGVRADLDALFAKRKPAG